MQPQSRWIAWNGTAQAFVVSFLLLAAAVGGALAFLSRGIAPSAAPQDTLYLLDNAWRVYCGQQPYNDFFALTGTLYAYLVALGFRLHGLTPDAIAYSLILPALLCPLAGWLLARRRFGALESFLFAASILLIVVRPSREESMDYAGVYNNVAAGIWLPFLLALALPLPLRSRNGEVLAGLGLGATAFLLWQAKISFGVYSFGLLVLATILVHRRPLRLIAALAAWTALWAVLIAGFHIPLGRIIADSRMITSASGLNSRLVDVVRTTRTLLPQIVLLGAMAAVVLGARPRQEQDRRRVLVALLFVAMGLVVSTIGGIYAQYVDLLLCLLVLADYAVRERMAGPVVAACWIAAAGTLGCNAYQSAKAMAYCWPHRAPVGGVLAGTTSAMNQPLPLIPLQAGDVTLEVLASANGEKASVSKEAYLASLRDRMKRGEALSPSPGETVVLIEDGMRLLAENAKDNAPIVSLQWSNPFSFLLRRAPAKGDIMWWDMGRTISPRLHPSPETILGHAGWVMESRLPSFEDRPTKAEAVRGELERSFAPAASSEFWTLWKRRP